MEELAKGRWRRAGILYNANGGVNRPRYLVAAE
jgi:hypothetical protein